MLWVLSGELGAIQFLVYTNWNLPHVQRELDSEPLNKCPYMFHKPMAADLGYHSPKPTYEGQDKMTDKCKHLGDRPCYYDGSGLRAEKVFDILLKEGGDGVWKELENEYTSRFGELK